MLIDKHTIYPVITQLIKSIVSLNNIKAFSNKI